MKTKMGPLEAKGLKTFRGALWATWATLGITLGAMALALMWRVVEASFENELLMQVAITAPMGSDQNVDHALNQVSDCIANRLIVLHKTELFGGLSKDVLSQKVEVPCHDLGDAAVRGHAFNASVIDQDEKDFRQREQAIDHVLLERSRKECSKKTAWWQANVNNKATQGSVFFNWLTPWWC